MKFAAVPREERVGLDLDHAVAVAGGPTAATGFPLAGESHANIAVDAGGDRHPPLHVLFL